jgi:hypothetical protein
MSILKWLAGIVLTIILIKVLVFPDFVHRYRLTIEVDTPDGLKSGSSVYEVTRRDERWILIAQGRYISTTRGQAVFVDLGGGKNVVGLMAFGDTATDVDRMTTLHIQAFLSHAQRFDEDVWNGQTRLHGTRELTGDLIPTLVTFSDLNNPETARVVWPQEFPGVFGPGYTFRRETIEILPSGWLAGWFQDLRPTQGIERKLLWWEQSGRPAFRAHLAMRHGSRVGETSSAEYLFVRR